MNYKMNIAKYLLLFRKWNSMTQTECGDMIGYSFQQWQKYEKGTNEMTAAKLLSVSANFKKAGNLFDMDAVINKSPEVYLEELGEYHKHPALYHWLRKAFTDKYYTSQETDERNS